MRRAGKYLNVVRECGRDVTCPEAKEVLYTLKERVYVEQIEKAYNYASKVLLSFLMEEKELVSRLRLRTPTRCFDRCAIRTIGIIHHNNSHCFIIHDMNVTVTCHSFLNLDTYRLP